MHPKNIAIIHPSSELYGADRILVEAIKNFSDESRKVIYLREEGPLCQYIQDNCKNVEIKFNPQIPLLVRNELSFIGLFRLLVNTIRFKVYLKKEKNKYNFDLFYLNTLATALILVLLNTRSGKRIIHVHEIIEKPRYLNIILSRIACRYSDLIVCVSYAVKNGLVLGGGNSCNMVVVHNGIPKLNVDHHINLDGPLRFYLFGRIMPKKGQWLMVDAVDQIPKELLKNSEFIIVGGVLKGHEYLLEDLQNYIHEKKLGQWIKIEGFTPDITGHMDKADVCIIPSLMKDPFPTTVLEAMSAGRVVIASNTGGAVEAILDGETGFLFDPSINDDLANRIELVLNNRKELLSIGERAHSRYNRKFNVDAFSKNWKGLISSLSTNV